ncbi:putative deoxyribonuclease YjjV [Piscirickettsia salmonis]|uniref:TatD family hydrolase n=1 Tax=Piscirickettsia salmonis TaxID=1238 RepID=UPI0012B977D0|nr:TatD family hydrolase [Piscirickettsia salmonis]QGP48903.1 putative deoxyribonuclease YjjV [Piscirickettsia salmonis]QGP56355.1 putative deoxyribonuclease YjjV [Piscirickettsia salmonis]QGP57782.1 putative deoxyribonuclease YjjV [Piscirickettsia salmonis]QGP65918.1 putative deoxyribonuclease YjjV [Piscirickettsia salmonis]
MIFDTHCHLDFDVFDQDLSAVLARAAAVGVTRFMLPGVSCQNWQKVRQLSAQYPGFYYALGLHPYFLNQHQEDDLVQLEQELQTDVNITAVGEIGLDGHLKHLDEKLQYHFFNQQLALANQYNKPVILHVRHRHDKVIQALHALNFSCGGVIHAFSGSVEVAKRYVQLGFKLGLGSVLTYTNSRKLRAVVKSLPLASFVLETDAPDMPMRGQFDQRNEPCFIVQVLAALDSERRESRETIIQNLWKNSLLLFKI